MEVANNNSVLMGYPPYLDEKRCAGKGSEIDSLAEFFFGIDDLLDFPNEEIIAAPIHPGSSDVGLSFSLSSVKSDVNLTAPPSLLPLWDGNHPSELCVTCDDVAELEWLSHFVDESFSSADNDLLQYSKEEDGNKSHSPSSTSLPENKGSNSNSFSSSDGGDSNSNENGKRSLATMVPGRPRSKRARKGIAGAGWNSSSRMLLPSTPLDDSSFSPSPSPSSSSSSSSSPNSNLAITFLDCSDTPFIIHPHFQYINPFANSCNQPQLSSLEEDDDRQATIMKKPKPKSTKPKMKPKPMLVMNCGAIPNPVQQPTVVDQSLPLRKCLHCGSQKTPQWRAGPLGPKTLCNACGVRHKSGRLFPEYRPAASPTFMESRHSNSHRKVLEMRRFKESSTTHNSIFT